MEFPYCIVGFAVFCCQIVTKFSIRHKRSSTWKVKMRKNGYVFMLCISLLYVYLKTYQQISFNLALLFGNEMAFSKENMMIFQ